MRGRLRDEKSEREESERDEKRRENKRHERRFERVRMRVRSREFKGLGIGKIYRV